MNEIIKFIRPLKGGPKSDLFIPLIRYSPKAPGLLTTNNEEETPANRGNTKASIGSENQTVEKKNEKPNFSKTEALALSHIAPKKNSVSAQDPLSLSLQPISNKPKQNQRTPVEPLQGPTRAPPIMKNNFLPKEQRAASDDPAAKGSFKERVQTKIKKANFAPFQRLIEKYSNPDRRPEEELMYQQAMNIQKIYQQPQPLLKPLKKVVKEKEKEKERVQQTTPPILRPATRGQPPQGQPPQGNVWNFGAAGQPTRSERVPAQAPTNLLLARTQNNFNREREPETKEREHSHGSKRTNALPIAPPIARPNSTGKRRPVTTNLPVAGRPNESERVNALPGAESLFGSKERINIHINNNINVIINNNGNMRAFEGKAPQRIPTLGKKAASAHPPINVRGEKPHQWLDPSISQLVDLYHNYLPNLGESGGERLRKGPPSKKQRVPEF